MDQPRIVRELLLFANSRYMNKEDVCYLKCVTRFILGLYDDIKLFGEEGLRAHEGYKGRMRNNE